MIVQKHPLYLSTSQAAARLKLHRNMVTHLRNAGRFPNAFKAGRNWRYPIAEVDAMDASRTGLYAERRKPVPRKKRPPTRRQLRQSHPKPEELISPVALAVKLGISRQRVHQLANAHDLAGIRNWRGRAYFTPDEVARMTRKKRGCPKGTKRTPGLKRRRLSAEERAAIPFSPSRIQVRPDPTAIMQEGSHEPLTRTTTLDEVACALELSPRSVAKYCRSSGMPYSLGSQVGPGIRAIIEQAFTDDPAAFAK